MKISDLAPGKIKSFWNKYLALCLFSLVIFLQTNAQIPTTDSARKYIDHYIRSNAIDAFANQRLNLLLKSLTNLVDSASLGAGATISLSKTTTATQITVTPTGGGTPVVIDSANSVRAGVLTIASWRFLDSLHRGLISIGGSGSPNTPVGTNFKIAIAGTNNVKGLIYTAGLTADSTSNPNSITGKWDSAWAT
ncbi:MAG: hypothetical protein H0X33_14770, partial [Taibaiella sp.]|nr:hypothetical protein [Taibaiella sp.]